MVESASQGIDFLNFDKLVEGIAAVVREERLAGTREQDIVIDVTGGFKTTSIAGAMVTLSSRVKFQYVETVSPFAVYLYDVVYEAPMSLEP